MSNNMYTEVFLIVKYPYTAGIIALIWISTAVLVLINNSLPIVSMITINMGVSLLIAFLGFRTKS